MSQNAKADAGKLELDLVPMQILRDIAEVRMYGNKKYGSSDNWKQVELRRYVNAFLRHMTAFVEDIYSVDEESGIPHYKHMACNMAFISDIMQRQEKPTSGEERLLRELFAGSDKHGQAGGKAAKPAGD